MNQCFISLSSLQGHLSFAICVAHNSPYTRGRHKAILIKHIWKCFSQMSKWRDIMMIQSTSISPRKKERREGMRAGRNTAGCWCFSAEPRGRILGAEQSGWLSCWTMEREQWKSELCFAGKDRAAAAPRNLCIMLLLLWKASPSKPNLSLQFSALFILASQGPKGWARALHHLPGYVFTQSWDTEHRGEASSS